MADTPALQPKISHAHHVGQLAEQLAGTMVLTGIKGNVNHPTAIDKVSASQSAPEVKETPAAVGGENNTAEAEASGDATSSANESNTASEGSQAEGNVAAPLKSVVEAKDSASQRLQRSLDIQKRAEKAAMDARVKTKQAEADKKEAVELRRQAAEDKVRISQIEADYQKKVALLKTNPLEFAKQHGVSGKEVADFVREGADPKAREIALLREDMAREITAIRKEAGDSIAEINNRWTSEKAAIQAENVNRAFFDYVDNAVKDQPDQFQALDVVYSRQELLSKANELADRNDRLQLGMTPDKLLEEIENDAKADPRWQKISSRYTRPSKVDPKAPVTKKNPTPEEKPVEEVRASNKPRNDDGTYQGRKLTPMESHQAHVARIARNVRF